MGDITRHQSGQHLSHPALSHSHTLTLSQHNAQLQLNILRRCVMWGQINTGKMLSLKLSSLLILLIIVDTISSLTLTRIEVPKYAKVGDKLRLVCNFSLGTDQLYSVKW